MFTEASFQEMLLTSWEKHIFKHTLIIEYDMINLLYCKTSSSAGFENKSEFFCTKMVAVLREKTYQNS